MTIEKLIELNYNKLHNLCKKKYIRRIERQCTNNDFEDEDILHSLIILWMKKYKNINFINLNKASELLYTEFVGYSKYQLMKSNKCLVYLSFYEYFLEQKNRNY